MAVERVETRIAESQRDIKRFLALPRELHADDPTWIPSLRVIDFIDFRLKRSDLLRRSVHALLLAYSDGIPSGGLIVYIDPQVNEYFGSEMAYFGAFQCVDDLDVSRSLFTACCEWAKDNGANVIRGPMDPDSQSWGFVIEGFRYPPVFMSPYSRPYYDNLAVDSGFSKTKDMFAYEADAATRYTIPERFIAFTETLRARRPEITVRRIKPEKLADEAKIILELLNAGTAGNWGFVPATEDEMREIVSKLKRIYDPDAIWFVQDSGRPVGCALGFPDANVLIKQIDGKLFPFGLFRFFGQRKKIRNLRLWGLAIMPQYQGQDLDVLLYVQLYQALQPRGVRLEASYVLEDNFRMRNALEKLGMKIIKRYRVYDKPL